MHEQCYSIKDLKIETPQLKNNESFFVYDETRKALALILYGYEKGTVSVYYFKDGKWQIESSIDYFDLVGVYYDKKLKGLVLINAHRIVRPDALVFSAYLYTFLSFYGYYWMDLGIYSWIYYPYYAGGLHFTMCYDSFRNKSVIVGFYNFFYFSCTIELDGYSFYFSDTQVDWQTCNNGILGFDEVSKKSNIFCER